MQLGPEPLHQFHLNLAQSIWVKGIQVLRNEELRPFPRGNNIENTLTKFKCLLFQNHWAIFNQNWFNPSLGEGDSSLFKRSPHPLPRGGIYEIAELHWRNLRKLLQNNWANYNQTFKQSFIGWKRFNFKHSVLKKEMSFFSFNQWYRNIKAFLNC